MTVTEGDRYPTAYLCPYVIKLFKLANAIPYPLMISSYQTKIGTVILFKSEPTSCVISMPPKISNTLGSIVT